MRARTRIRRGGVLLSVALVGASLLAACSGSSSSGTASGITKADINLYNGATGSMTRNYNPFSPTALGGTRGMIYETLYFFNQAKAQDNRPWLAEKYGISTDGKKITFTIRQGVKWSDGQPFGADDVAFTFNYLKQNPKINTNGLPLAGAKKIDDKTVEVDFTQSAFAFVWYAAGQTPIVPQHIWQSISDPSTNQNQNPVGTGGFMFKAFNPQSFTLVKNPNYWQPGKPGLNSVRFVSYSGNTAALTALNTGQIDWAGIFIPDIEKAYVAKDKAVNKYVNFTPGFITNLVPNLDKWPTNQLPVRQAINYALDREELNKLAFSGSGSVPSAAGIVLPRDQKYLAPEYQDLKPPNDPAKAKDTLTAAGYTLGSDGIYRDKSGKKLSVGCIVVTGYSDYISALQIVKQEL